MYCLVTMWFSFFPVPWGATSLPECHYFTLLCALLLTSAEAGVGHNHPAALALASGQFWWLPTVVFPMPLGCQGQHRLQPWHPRWERCAMMSLRQVRFFWEMLRYVGVSATAELSVLPAITSCNVQLKYMWTNNLIIKKLPQARVLFGMHWLQNSWVRLSTRELALVARTIDSKCCIRVRIWLKAYSTFYSSEKSSFLCVLPLIQLLQ